MGFSMLKHICLTAALLLTACGATESPAAPNVPAQDALLAMLQADYPVTLSKIADGVWVHTTNYNLPGQNPIPVNGLVVLDGDDVILVDGAWGELATLSLVEKIKEKTGKMPTKMIVTNHESDRTAGVDAAEWQGLQVFTHPDTPRLAAAAGYSAPDTSVAALKAPKARTKVGALEVAFPGPGVTPDNLVVYVPSANILYGGDLVRAAGAKTLGNTSNADLEKWAESLQWIKATYPDTKVVVPGHGQGANITLLDATYSLIKAETSAETSEETEAP